MACEVMSVYEPAMLQQGQVQDMVQLAQPYMVAMLVPAALMTPAQVVTNCSPVNQSDTYVPYAQNAGQEVQWQFQAPYAAMGQGSMENPSYSPTYGQYDDEAWGKADGQRHRRRRRTGENPKAPGKASTICRQSKENAALLDENQYNKLCQQVEAGSDKERASAVAQILKLVWPYSQHPLGCRLVQLAIDKSSDEVGKAIAEQLHGHVKEAAESPHANYVLQKVIERLTPPTSSFIAAELLPHVQRFARHRFGCRIVCRLVALCSSEETTQMLLDALLQDDAEALDLCKHNFGHHVVQAILEHGRTVHDSQQDSRDEKKTIADLLCFDLLEIAKNRSSSYVLETALNHCAPEDQQRMVQFLVQPAIVSELAKADFGVFVVRTLLKHPSVNAEVLIQTVPALADVMRNETA